MDRSTRAKRASRKKFKRAEAKVPQVKPEDVRLGEVYSRLNRYEEAIEAYQKGAQRNPNHPLLSSGLGMAYFYTARWNEAIVHLERAVRMKPDDADAHFFLSMVCYKLGRKEEGDQEFKKAFDLTHQMAGDRTPEWITGYRRIYLKSSRSGSRISKWIRHGATAQDLFELQASVESYGSVAWIFQSCGPALNDC
jgi:tetratricopeptide (TPR) repeat protein